jgi:cytochrome c-type biogenesis protein CcmF
MIATTSIPVFNALTGLKVAPPIDPIAHFNQFQGAFAVVILLVTGFTQFLKYKRTDPKKFWSATLVILFSSIIISAVVIYFAHLYSNLMYILITFTAIYCLLVNGRILIDAVQGKWRLTGSAVSHIGFALLVLGALIAAATNEVISLNESGYIGVKNFGKEGDKFTDPGENLFLTEGEPVQMGDYKITYLGDSIVPPNVYYHIKYEKVDEESGKTLESFTLSPFAQNNPAMGGLIGTPDTRHYLTHDIYTLITAASAESHAPANNDERTGYEDYDEPATYEVNIGDTLRYRNGIFVVQGINKNATLQNIPLSKEDLLVGININVIPADGKESTVEPIYLLREGTVYDFNKDVVDQGLRFRFTNIYPQRDKLEIMVYQKPLPEKKWIVFKAIKFPYINFFWAGTIVMTIGFLMAIYRRIKEAKNSKKG